MKIIFKDLEILSKNSKRLSKSIKNLNINNKSFISVQNDITLTTFKDILSKSYGYTGFNEIIQNHKSDNAINGILLENLSNEELINIDKQIFENLFNLLKKRNVDKNIAAVASAACCHYLNKKLKNKKLKENKKLKYKSYTDIGKLYNFSMQKAKSIINKGKYLNNHFPTDNAIREGKCTVQYIESDSYGNKPKYLWEINYINKLFSRNKIKVPTGYDKFSYGKSPYYIEKNIISLVKCLIDILPNDIKKEYEKKYEFYGFEPFIAVEAQYYTGVDWESFIYSSFDDLIIEADKYNPKEVSKIEKVIAKNISWLNKNKP